MCDVLEVALAGYYAWREQAAVIVGYFRIAVSACCIGEG
jgi:hypothetical protein